MRREISIIYRIPTFSPIDHNTSLDTVLELGQKHKTSRERIDQDYGHVIECLVKIARDTIDSKISLGFKVEMRDLEENSGELSMKHSIQRYIGSMNQPDFVLKDSEDGLVRKVLRSIGYAMMEQTNGYLVVRNKSIYSGHRPSRMSKRPMLYRRI